MIRSSCLVESKQLACDESEVLQHRVAAQWSMLEFFLYLPVDKEERFRYRCTSRDFLVRKCTEMSRLWMSNSRFPFGRYNAPKQIFTVCARYMAIYPRIRYHLHVQIALPSQFICLLPVSHLHELGACGKHKSILRKSPMRRSSDVTGATLWSVSWHSGKFAKFSCRGCGRNVRGLSWLAVVQI